MSGTAGDGAAGARRAGIPPGADEAGAAFDVLALGELRVDLVATRPGPLAAAPGFTRTPGGAAANVAAGVARLGRRAAFLGLVGDDPFGRYLAGALQSHGVDTTYLGFHPRGHTPVAFVTQGAHPAEADEGEAEEFAALAAADPAPQVLFYREGGADQLWSPAWVSPGAVHRARVLMAGGVSLASALPRAALQTAFGYAAEAGVPVAFNVNWQPAVWQYPERARDLYHTVLPAVDILKLSSQELILLAGGVASSEESRLEAVLHAWVERLVVGRTRPLLVALTRGPAGCSYGLWRPGRGGFEVRHLAACEIAVKDRTGAGEAFLAGLLVALLDHLAPLAPRPAQVLPFSLAAVAGGNSPPPTVPSPAGTHLDLGLLDLPAVADIFAWANASGAAATARRGTLAALPGRTAVLRLIKGRRPG